MFSSIKIALALFVLASAGAGYMYVKKIEGDLQTARENVAKMEVAIQVSEASIKMMETDIKRTSELNMQLQGDLQKAEKYGDELRATLQKHNLTMLALKKPAMIEQRMQDATTKIWADITTDTDPSRVQSPAPGSKSNNGN
mgnify:FL=1|jgi:hypothetical protein|tara:strand:- start:1127 stop:1549 length:423 start_codon:yes stop_codon:yes gene_type:complete